MCKKVRFVLAVISPVRSPFQFVCEFGGVSDHWIGNARLQVGFIEGVEFSFYGEFETTLLQIESGSKLAKKWFPNPNALLHFEQKSLCLACNSRFLTSKVTTIGIGQRVSCSCFMKSPKSNKKRRIPWLVEMDHVIIMHGLRVAEKVLFSLYLKLLPVFV